MKSIKDDCCETDLLKQEGWDHLNEIPLEDLRLASLVYGRRVTSVGGDSHSPNSRKQTFNSESFTLK